MTSPRKTHTHTLTPKARAWRLELYVLDATPPSQRAQDNLERVCEQYLSNQCHIKVVDLATRPQAALAEEIVAVPTLICRYPLGKRRLVGDLSNTANVLQALGIPAPTPPVTPC